MIALSRFGTPTGKDAGRSGQTGLRGASIGALGVLLGSAAISYLGQLGTVRLVGVESFGIYIYALAWLTLLAQFATLGSNVSLLRLASGYQGQGAWPLMAGVLRVAFGATAASGLLLAALVMWGLRRWGPGGDLGLTLMIGAAAIPLLSLQLVAASAVRVFGAVVQALVPERLVRDSLALVVLGFLYLSGLAAPGAPAAMAGMMVSAAVIFAMSAVLAARFWPVEARGLPWTHDLRRWLRPTLPLTVIMVADVVMARFGIVVLGLFGRTAEAGLFGVCLGLSLLAALPRMAVAAAFAPNVASLHAKGDSPGLQLLVRRGAWLSCLGSLGIALPMVLAAPLLLSLFSASFAAASPIVAVLVLGQVVAGAAGPQQHLMTMTGHEATGARMHLGSALFGTALALALVPAFGVLGAAVATTAAMSVWNIAMAVFAFRQLGLRPGLLTFVRPAPTAA